MLTEQGGAWLYKRNESPLTRTVTKGIAQTTARLGPAQILPWRPGGGLAGGSPGGDGGFGLFSLRSRSEELGGDLKLGAGKRGGTRAVLCLPLPKGSRGEC